MSQHHGIQGGVVAALFIIAGAVIWHSSFPQAEQPHAPLPAPPLEVAEPVPLGGAPPAPPLAEVGGAVRLDAEGRLSPDLDLRYLYEHFLEQAAGPQDLPAIRESLRRHLQTLALPAESEAAVLEGFDRYLVYLQAAAELPQGGTAPAELATTLEILIQLRRELLGLQLAEAFYAKEEAYDRYSIERRRLEAAAELSEEARTAALAALEQTLPERHRAQRERVLVLVQLERDTAALQAQNAGPEQIYSLRVARFGAEAAERLGRLDAEDAQWERRLNDYRAERAAVMASGLDPSDRAQALEALLERHFDGPERIRVRALERIGQTH